MSQTDKPLATLSLIAYNQDAFIKEAIEGAFAQTYSPLQILLSDDASTDDTFRIMTEMAQTYHGNHQLLLNRNPENLGIGAHINRAMELAEGELIITAAGDDVCLPRRVEALVDAWLKSGRTAYSLHSRFERIDEQGRKIGGGYIPNLELLDSLESIITTDAHVVGATHAWDRRVYDVFGPMDPEVVHEDRTIILRSRILGHCQFVDEVLVRYRTGGISADYALTDAMDIFSDVTNRKAARFVKDNEQKIRDLKLAEQSEHLIRLAERNREKWAFIEALSARRSVLKTCIEYTGKGVSAGFVLKTGGKYLMPNLYTRLRKLLKKKSA